MKLLASDFDETLKRNGKVSRSDLKAIQRFRAEKNKFGIVTARSVNMIMDALRFYHIPYDFLIAINGGLILDADGTVLKRELIAFHKVEEILRYLEHIPVDIAGCCNGREYCCFKHGKKLYDYLRYLVLKLRMTPVTELLATQEIASFFLLSDDPLLVETLYQHFLADDLLQVVKNGTRVVDLSAPQADKAKAVAFLSEYYQIKDCYVIGDSHNDLSMIRAYQGYAIEEAEAEVKAIARAVVRDFSELMEKINEADV